MKLMKTIRLIFCLVCSIALFSCSKNDDTVSSVNKGIELTIKAYQENSTDETRTILQEDGKVFWTPGDAISVFYKEGTDGGSKFVAQNAEVAEITEFKGTLNNFTGGGEDLSNESYFWGIYPYSSDNQCGDNSVTINVASKQNALEGTFAKNMFPTVARSKGLELAFYNICGGVKFSVSQPGIRSICFKANNNETIAGKVKVEFGADGKPVVSEVLDGSDEVMLSAPNGGTFKVEQYYYITALPIKLEGGFTITLYKDFQKAEVSRETAVTIKRSVFGKLTNIDRNITEWTDIESTPDYPEGVQGGGKEEGLYVGIIAFNNNLYRFPITRVTEQSLGQFNSFIDNMTLNNHTILCWAVDNAFTDMLCSAYPTDLYKASIITFTDGLERGSLQLANWVYNSNEEYLSAINSRLSSEKVSGQLVSGYSIGVIGKDVDSNDSNSINKFRNQLKMLATSDQNAFEVNSMSAVYTKFLEIADELSETFDEQILVLSDITVGQAPVLRTRFTLDNASTANSSKKYIEGVIDYRTGIFSEIEYHGLTSTSGETLTGKPGTSGIASTFEFEFEGLRSADGKLISKNDITHWEWLDTYWQKNREYNLDKSVQVITEKRSAAIMLVLDSSSSLGDDDLLTLQKAAKSFIAKVYQASIDPLAVSSVNFNKSAITLNVGDYDTIIATVLPSTASDKRLAWSSNNTAVATVDGSGKVVAVSPGEALIYATSLNGDKMATCQVTVVKLAENVGLSTSELSLYTGETATLSATVSPENTSDKSIEWKSSAPSIAKVDQNGTITAIKAGTAIITARAADGSGKEASCTVTVKQHVTSVSISPSSLSLHNGQTSTLDATVLPSDATDKTLSWKSSDVSVAIVDDSGNVTGIGRGRTTVTATSRDGELESKCEVEVRQLADEISIDESAVTLYTGESAELSATVLPEDTSDKTVQWSSSNTAVATVDQNGIITAIKAGTATIKATSTDGSNVSASCTVTVLQHVNGIAFSSPSLNLPIDETLVLKPEFLPADASNRQVIWEVADENILQIDDSGKLTPLSLGTTTVTATTVEGGYSASCEITVTLSTTLKDLSLAVTKDGNRYFVTQEEYDSYDLGEYTAEGVAINYSNQKFIIEIGELSSSDFKSSETGATASRIPSIRPIIPGGGTAVTVTYTFSFEDANRLNNLPSYNQAQVICNRLTQINDAAKGFGLNSLISTAKKYWTSHKSYNSSFWYMYNGSLESTSSSSSKFYAKPVITL